MDLQLVLPKPCSLSASQAASWYRTMIPIIPKLPVTFSGDTELEQDYEKFKAQWSIKSALRYAAAQALIEQGLAEEFLMKFRLPTAEEYMGVAYVSGRGKFVFEYALDSLASVSEREHYIFPGTIGESLGMKCFTNDGVYVVTKDGWEKES